MCFVDCCVSILFTVQWSWDCARCHGVLWCIDMREWQCMQPWCADGADVHEKMCGCEALNCGGKVLPSLIGSGRVCRDPKRYESWVSVCHSSQKLWPPFQTAEKNVFWWLAKKPSSITTIMSANNRSSWKNVEEDRNDFSKSKLKYA
jgi:hypothetical protein